MLYMNTSIFVNYKSIIELTPDNFDLKNNKIIHPKLVKKKGMVTFTSNHCMLCKYLTGVYSTVALKLETSFPMFNLDCIKYPQLAYKLGISRYSLIKYIDETGIMYKEYNGYKTVDLLLADINHELHNSLPITSTTPIIPITPITPIKPIKPIKPITPITPITPNTIITPIIKINTESSINVSNSSPNTIITTQTN